MDFVYLAIPAFVAGIVMFLAPCTLPLVPGYLSFISGIPLRGLQAGAVPPHVRWRVFLNGVGFVVGFSVVFIALGIAAGFGGAQLVAYRDWLARIGGAFIIVFGLFMLHVVQLPWLQKEARLRLPQVFKPGNPINAGILGATFALGWSPCIGPVLGTVLLLASTSATLMQGGALLAIFSLGLALPFLAMAAATGTALHIIARLRGALVIINVIGGIFLVTLGFLMLFGDAGWLVSYGYQWFDFIGYERLLEWL